MPTDEEAVILGIDSYAGRRVDTFERDMALDLQRLRVEDAELVLVFKRHVDHAVLTSDDAFAIAANRNSADNLAAGAVNCGDVVGAMVVGEDTV